MAYLVLETKLSFAVSSHKEKCALLCMNWTTFHTFRAALVQPNLLVYAVTSSDGVNFVFLITPILGAYWNAGGFENSVATKFSINFEQVIWLLGCNLFIAILYASPQGLPLPLLSTRCPSSYWWSIELLIDRYDYVLFGC